MSKVEVNTIEPQCGTTLTVGKCTSTVAVPGAATVTGTATAGTLKSDTHQAADGGVIISQSGTDITIGASGDTVALASGASQTGFGRTGTVDWNTTPVTSTPTTGVSGNGYFLNTTSGILTVNLPATPSAGDIMAVADYAGTAASNNITIGRNGSNIEGGTTDGTISTNRETKTLVYVDGTQGWVPVNDNFDSLITPQFIVATSPSVATSGDYKIHTFTGPGTFCVSCAGNAGGSNTVDYMVVAGGCGGGATEHAGNNRAGGAGAGGYRESPGTASGCYAVSPLGAAPAVALPVSVQGYPIAVGGGGPGVYGGVTNGVDSTFSSITSAGGGSGGECSPSPTAASGTGGSGGGASARGSGAAGNTPPVSPPQGQNGAASTGFCGTGGGGGGAGATGSPAPTGGGGNGVTSSINGTPTTRAGGGGAPGGSACNGGTGGGGDANGGAGTVNTGGGGAGSYGPTSTGGTGGSGIVIIRYKFQ